jgi:succinate dehydrogenase subunit D
MSTQAYRSNRPLPWMLFGIGGFLVAIFFPIHILLYGIVLPLGWLPYPTYESTLRLLEAPGTRVYLGIILVFAFWHSAYRIRDTICDAFDVRQLDILIAALCYAGATAGTIATIVLLCYVP